MNTIETLLMVGEGGKPNPMMNVVFMVGMIGVMYFFLIRPQMKRAKEQKEFSNSTSVGDMIVTTAGIHGKIIKTNEDGTISVEVDRNTVLKMDKSAVSMELTAALRKKMNEVSKG
ncbi:MAG TPA: preprotein translocase subunit YajC [Chitinophagaceae bacterium]|jgi:preprotein translocase subunit YajC|nr:preprotein translocase subunit YajC [Chitinophagaceae bacterium]HQW47412.1 preprotein translocase subunit YajC [Chitinophagaceae bacterium]